MPSSLGTKRTSDRSMEKCEGCRSKRVKVSPNQASLPKAQAVHFLANIKFLSDHAQCLPTTRDWSKGERCYPCENKDEDCGPNTRARKPRRKAAPNIRPADRLLAPSPPPAPVPALLPSVPDHSSPHEMSVANDCQLSMGVSSSFESKSSQALTPQTPEQASSIRKALVRSEENDPIVARYVPVQCNGD
jgi:hypothetical protein